MKFKIPKTKFNIKNKVRVGTETGHITCIRWWKYTGEIKYEVTTEKGDLIQNLLEEEISHYEQP